jgi:hypothetical protein
MGIDFDTLDMPKGRFVTGGEAWMLSRSGAADPDSFGIFDMKGLGFGLGDFIRDVALLNKAELLPWDCWGLMLKDTDKLTAEEYELLDRAAELAAAGDERIIGLYEETPCLKVSGAVKSYLPDNVDEFAFPPFSSGSSITSPGSCLRSIMCRAFLASTESNMIEKS